MLEFLTIPQNFAKYKALVTEKLDAVNFQKKYVPTGDDLKESSLEEDDMQDVELEIPSDLE